MASKPLMCSVLQYHTKSGHKIILLVLNCLLFFFLSGTSPKLQEGACKKEIFPNLTAARKKAQERYKFRVYHSLPSLLLFSLPSPSLSFAFLHPPLLCFSLHTHFLLLSSLFLLLLFLSFLIHLSRTLQTLSIPLLYIWKHKTLLSSLYIEETTH